MPCDDVFLHREGVSAPGVCFSRSKLSPFLGGQFRPHLTRGSSLMSEIERAHGIKLPVRGNGYGVDRQLKEDKKDPLSTKGTTSTALVSVPECARTTCHGTHVQHTLEFRHRHWVGDW